MTCVRTEPLLLIACLMPAGLVLASPYLQNPLVEWGLRQSWEARLDLQFNFDNNEDPPAAFLAGVGYGATDALTIGLYGLVRASDRDMPSRMKRMYGFGGYATYRFAPFHNVVPFVEGRAGFLDPTGPGYSIACHLAAATGVQIPLSDRLSLALSGAIQWAENDLFNYRGTHNQTSGKGDYIDITLDTGLRFAF